MRLTPSYFISSLQEDGLKKTLTQGYLFSEALALYWLTKTPLIGFLGKQVEIDSLERNSDTVFLLGSGYSVNNITKKEWSQINEHADTLAFNYFFRGEFVPIDFHIVREITQGWNLVQRHTDIRSYFEELSRNPMYADTTYLVLRDKQATDSIWGTFFLNYLKDERVCFYSNDRSAKLPGESVDEITHHAATLFDAINFAYLLGYDEIVLVGVDLYDRRYFWLDRDETRDVDEQSGASKDDEHKTSNPVLELTPTWNRYLSERGVTMYVENQKSLLKTESVLQAYDIENRLPAPSENW